MATLMHPWKNDELETMLRDVISHGAEALKIDFKAEIETATWEQKSELLKDITAIANTSIDKYEDHGFLIYGVTGKTIAGTSKTEQDADKFQNTIDQLLKTYIAPMPEVYVLAFEDSGNKWGAIIIPPQHSKPFMFAKEVQCTADPKRSRKRGEWFVRRGTTTDAGMPEDLARIMQKQTELLVLPLRESIANLRARVDKTDEQFQGALYKLIQQSLGSSSSSADAHQIPAAASAIGIDLHTRLRQQLRRREDPDIEELIAKARELNEFLDAKESGISWTPQTGNQAENESAIRELEQRVRSLQLAFATIMLLDHERRYTSGLLRTLKLLAVVHDAPLGASFNDGGMAIRLYPLGILLYTIFATASVTDNLGALLKEVLATPLKRRDRSGQPMPEVFFLWHQARALFNDAAGKRWCEPIGQRIHALSVDELGTMFLDAPVSEAFYCGEFLLGLASIDERLTSDPNIERAVPIPGQYLYLYESQNAIKVFLESNPEWLEGLFENPLESILDAFDQNAHKVVASGCIGHGIVIRTVDIWRSSKKAGKVN